MRVDLVTKGPTGPAGLPGRLSTGTLDGGVMLIILIALVVGLVVVMAALFYYWRTPGVVSIKDIFWAVAEPSPI